MREHGRRTGGETPREGEMSKSEAQGRGDLGGSLEMWGKSNQGAGMRLEEVGRSPYKSWAVEEIRVGQELGG